MKEFWKFVGIGLYVVPMCLLIIVLATVLAPIWLPILALYSVGKSYSEHESN